MCESSFVGKSWQEIPSSERKNILKGAYVVGTNGYTISEGKGTVILGEKLAVLGSVKDGNITVSDDAVLYNPEV